jgi:hypothetical protein
MSPRRLFSNLCGTLANLGLSSFHDDNEVIAGVGMARAPWLLNSGAHSNWQAAYPPTLLGPRGNVQLSVSQPSSFWYSHQTNGKADRVSADSTGHSQIRV